MPINCVKEPCCPATACDARDLAGREPLAQRSPETDAVQRFYDDAAAEFAVMHEFWSNPYDRACWQLENSLVARYLSDVEPIADLGVGFYPHIDSTAGKRVICVDISPRSLAVARQQYHHCNPRMEYICADVTSLPFPDASLPGAIAGGEVINHVSAENFLRELARVLRPGGRAVVSVGMKWCIDGMYAVLDALTGHHIGFSMSRHEALRFLTRPAASTIVTWEITPHANLAVMLYSKREITKLLRRFNFSVLHVQSLNALSGLLPLPLQQDNAAPAIVKKLAALLLEADRRFVGRLPWLKWFAGNIYLVLENELHGCR